MYWSNRDNYICVLLFLILLIICTFFIVLIIIIIICTFVCNDYLLWFIVYIRLKYKYHNSQESYYAHYYCYINNCIHVQWLFFIMYLWCYNVLYDVHQYYTRMGMLSQVIIYYLPCIKLDNFTCVLVGF